MKYLQETAEKHPSLFGQKWKVTPLVKSELTRNIVQCINISKVQVFQS